MTTETLPALGRDHEAAVLASRAHKGSDAEFDRIIDEECAIARRIALMPATTVAELAIKAAVALREAGTTKFKIGEPVDCDAVLQIFDDRERPDLAELINVSIAIDIMRLAGKGIVPNHDGAGTSDGL